EVTPTAPSGSSSGQDVIAALGKRLSHSGVRVIVLLHGSIMGTDVFGVQRLDELGGLKRGYSRGVAGLDALLGLMGEGRNGNAPLPGGLKASLGVVVAIKGFLGGEDGGGGQL